MFRRVNWETESATRVERFRKQQFLKVKEKITYNNKIDYYIPFNWNFNSHKLHDYIIHLNYKIEVYTKNNKFKETLLDIALKKEYDNLSLLKDTLCNATYIVREINNKAIVLIFYGEEQRGFEKVMERKASFVDWVPQIIEGKICGKITRAEIMKVLFKYDKEYALYLKRLLDNKKLTNNIINTL